MPFSDVNAAALPGVTGVGPCFSTRCHTARNGLVSTSKGKPLETKGVLIKILFTGATGVLGRAAVSRLVEDGHDVVAVSGVDTVAHFATAIPPMSKMAERRSWETNDRLRSQATGILVDAWLDADSTVDPGRDVLDSALAAAMTAPDGTYNVGDDEPVTSAVYTDTLADLPDAPRPRRFREVTSWEPAFPSAREGWQCGRLRPMRRRQ